MDGAGGQAAACVQARLVDQNAKNVPEDSFFFKVNVFALLIKFKGMFWGNCCPLIFDVFLQLPFPVA